MVLIMIFLNFFLIIDLYIIAAAHMNSHSKHRFVQAAWKNAGLIHFDIKLHLFIVVSLARTLLFVHFAHF